MEHQIGMDIIAMDRANMVQDWPLLYSLSIAFSKRVESLASSSSLLAYVSGNAIADDSPSLDYGTAIAALYHILAFTRMSYSTLNTPLIQERVRYNLRVANQSLKNLTVNDPPLSEILRNRISAFDTAMENAGCLRVY